MRPCRLPARAQGPDLGQRGIASPVAWGMIMTDQTMSPAALEAQPERWLDGLIRGIYVIRVPLAMGILTILVLTMLDQVLEVHRVLTQERAINPFQVHWLLSLASLLALSVVLWQIARQHAENAEGDYPGVHIEP